MLEFQHAYHRHLSHIQPPNATIFVTYRLLNSLPQSVQDKLIAEANASAHRLQKIADPQERATLAYTAQKQQFSRWDNQLDTIVAGTHWLRRPAIAQIVADSLHHFDGKRYDLDCYTLMSNHAHVIFKPLLKAEGNYHSLSSIMHSHKRYTAWQANKELGRQGQFWQHESYDCVVRNAEELGRIRRYVLNNPVKAGLVETLGKWPWSWCRSSLQT